MREARIQKVQALFARLILTQDRLVFPILLSITYQQLEGQFQLTQSTDSMFPWPCYLLFQQVGFECVSWHISFDLHVLLAAREKMHFRKLLLTMRWNWRASPSQRQWGILAGFRLNLHLFLFSFWAEDTKYPKEIKLLVSKVSHTKPIFPVKFLAFWSKRIT